MGGGFELPKGIGKRDKATDLSDEKLMNFHDKLHILWKKLEDGYNFDWTFLEIYIKHMEIVMQMGSRDMKHLAPINELDLILAA